MGTIDVAQEGTVGAPADLTYRLIAADEHHKPFLPEGFSGFETVEGGVGGFFERTFAPKVMRKMYADELGRLDAYARSQAAA